MPKKFTFVNWRNTHLLLVVCFAQWIAHAKLKFAKEVRKNLLNSLIILVQPNPDAVSPQYDLSADIEAMVNGGHHSLMVLCLKRGSCKHPEMQNLAIIVYGLT